MNSTEINKNGEQEVLTCGKNCGQQTEKGNEENGNISEERR